MFCRLSQKCAERSGEGGMSGGHSKVRTDGSRLVWSYCMAVYFIVHGYWLM